MRIPIPFTKRELDISLTDVGWITRFTGIRASSGVTVTDKTALRLSAVYACVRVLAESIASLPLITYKRRAVRGKDRAVGYYLYPILHDIANDEMPSYIWRETMQGHVALTGNAYSEIEYDEYWRVKALWPLRPDRTFPERDPTTGEIRYYTTLANGQGIILPSYRVLHIPGLGYDGLKGYNPIELAKEAIGLALAAEEHGARFFGNGARPGGLLKHPGRFKDEAVARRIRESFEAIHGGLSKSNRVALLEEGMDYQQISIPNDQAQFLETRQYQVADIARLFRIPPHMIGDLTRSTNNNIEHQGIEFVTMTLRPWLVRWEQYINWKLFTPKERRQYFVEFLADGLMRGDLKSQYDALSVAINNGWMCPDEAREILNHNPMPNGQGEIYRVPVNTMPADIARDWWLSKVKGGETTSGKTATS